MTRKWQGAPSNLHATTIDEVIASLDKIVDWSKTNNKRTGYFAALYRKVTKNVKQGIETGLFDDGPRMEKLDVIFANRYLDAFEAYANGERVSDVWQLAFETTERWFPLALVHLMIGMNAHINFDLGIAAAETVDADQLSDLKPDFEKINDVLSSLVDEVENELAQIWPMFGVLDRFAGSLDERLADAGMAFARDRAWAFAEEVSAANNKVKTLTDMDKKMTAIGQLFLSPGLIKKVLLLLIRIAERGDISKKITVLE